MRIPHIGYFALGIIFALAACVGNTPEPSSHIPISTSEVLNVSTSTFVPTPSLAKSSLSPVPSFSGTIAIATLSRTRSGVVLLDLENGVIKDLSNYGHGSVSWSPDGQWLAISGGVPLSQRPPNIFLVKADGSETIPLTNSNESEYDLSWSPDGKFIVYAHSQGVPSELAIVQAETGISYSLTSTNGYESLPSWSPDGKQIAYAYSENGAPLQLWVALVHEGLTKKA